MSHGQDVWVNTPCSLTKLNGYAKELNVMMYNNINLVYDKFHIRRMSLKNSKQRLYAALLILGGGILLSRTIILLSQGYAKVFVFWVAVLLLLEFLLDLSWILSAIRWWISKTRKHARQTLRLAAAGILLHAVRVAIYVLARVGASKDFDIKPNYRIMAYTSWSREEVYFASIMSFLGVVGVILVWRFCNRK